MAEKTIKCGMCGVPCASIKEWRAHTANHLKQKPFEALPETFKCRSFIKRENRQCNRVFDDFDVFLKHKRKEHFPEWIRKSHWMKNQYLTYTKDIDDVAEYRNAIRVIMNGRRKITIPNENCLMTIRIGGRQKPFIINDVDQNDEDAHEKIRRQIEEQKTLRMIEEKRLMRIWNSDAASPGKEPMQRTKQRAFKIIRGIRFKDGKELSVCLHCAQSFKSITDWKKHTIETVIPMFMAYQKRKAPLRAPNKYHSFKAEKSRIQSKAQEFWEATE
jgi:uncharacterized C2H2 Zn-finger protein